MTLAQALNEAAVVRMNREAQKAYWGMINRLRIRDSEDGGGDYIKYC